MAKPTYTRTETDGNQPHLKYYFNGDKLVYSENIYGGVVDNSTEYRDDGSIKYVRHYYANGTVTKNRREQSATTGRGVKYIEYYPSGNKKAEHTLDPKDDEKIVSTITYNDNAGI